MTIIRKPAAVEDVFAIWLYIAADHQTAADALLDQIDAKLKLLEDHPNMGRMRPDLGAGLRSVMVGRYLLLYRTIGDGVELVRVVHGSRNLPDVVKPV